jgi:hypothetical protein
LPIIRTNPLTEGGTLDTIVDRLIKSSNGEPSISGGGSRCNHSVYGSRHNEGY